MPHSEAEWLAVMARVDSLWPDLKLNEQQLAEWRRALGSLNHDDVMQALSAIIAGSKFTPRLGDVTAAVARIQNERGGAQVGETSRRLEYFRRCQREAVSLERRRQLIAEGRAKMKEIAYVRGPQELPAAIDDGCPPPG